MKLSVFLMAASLFPAASQVFAADLGDLKTVYLLPMTNGMDQFLAIKLTTGVVMQVVTDPKTADAILTDRIGAGFEQKLDDLYGIKPKESEDKDKDDKDQEQKHIASSVTKGKGAIFLVDRKTRAVVWSDYERAKSASAEDMNRTAEKIAEKLEKDRKGK
jgi:hypothetical protein